jgi:hypothetical protein
MPMTFSKGSSASKGSSGRPPPGRGWRHHGHSHGPGSGPHVH